MAHDSFFSCSNCAYKRICGPGMKTAVTKWNVPCNDFELRDADLEPREDDGRGDPDHNPENAE